MEIFLSKSVPAWFPYTDNLTIDLTSNSSPRVTGLSTETIFGYKPPFSVHTCMRHLFSYNFLQCPNLQSFRCCRPPRRLTSDLHSSLFPCSQHQYCPWQGLGSNGCFKRKRARFLAAIRWGMGTSPEDPATHLDRRIVSILVWPVCSQAKLVFVHLVPKTPSHCIFSSVTPVQLLSCRRCLGLGLV